MAIRFLSLLSVFLILGIANAQDVSITCNDRLNVSLDEGCMAELPPAAVLEGVDAFELSNFYVKVAYPFDGHSINLVNRCGLFKYVVFRIIGAPDFDENANATGDLLPDEEICWGEINAEDKTPPLACVRKVIAIWKNPTAAVYRPVTNEDRNCDIDGVADGNDKILDKNFLSHATTNLLTCYDLDKIYNVKNSWQNVNYLYYTGSPDIADNCTPDNKMKWISVTDSLIDLECAYESMEPFPRRQLTQKIIRTFLLEDEKGNRTSVDQEICFFRPIIILPKCKVELNACSFPVYNPNVFKNSGPFPYFKNALGQSINFRDHTCNFTITFTEQFFPGAEKCGFKVMRTYTILDWCWHPTFSESFDLIALDPAIKNVDECPEIAYSDWHQKSLEWQQFFVVDDKQIPVVSCPPLKDSLDVQLQFNVDPFSCHANFQLPAPTVAEGCKYFWWAEIYSSIPKLWHGVPTGTYDIIRLDDAQVTVQKDEDAWLTNAVFVSGVPKGQHFIKYYAQDHCGNQGYSEMCAFYVIDEIEPVAVCDDDLTVSLSAGVGGDANPYGYGRVYAADVDEGSWDNCTPVQLKVRRFVSEACVEDFKAGSSQALETKKVTISKPGTQADGQKGYWTVWADYVDFVCCDVGTHPEASKVLVELGVWDNANMSLDAKGLPVYGDNVEPFKGSGFKQQDNFNTCWLEVLVEDKLAPICVAPHDMYLECEEVPYTVILPENGTKWSELTEREQGDLKDWFAALQKEYDTYPKGWDNCDVTVEMVDVKFNIHCKSGYVERIFQATDAWGRKSATCKQRIYLSRHHDYCIKFPKDASAECLEAPEIPGVELFEYGCDLLAVSVQDEIFNVPTSNEECYKMFRTYRVINWCQFDEDVDPGTPLFDRFDTYYDIEPLVVNRDEDEDGIPGDEDVYVRFFGWANDDDFKNELDRWYDEYGFTIGFENYEEGTYGVTFIDKNCDPFDYEHYDATEGYWRSAHYARGFYQYTQVVKVFDPVPPVVLNVGEVEFPSYAGVGLGDKAETFANGLPTVCTGNATLEVEVSEVCTKDVVNLKAIYLIPDKALGVGAVLVYKDGKATKEGESFGLVVTKVGLEETTTTFTISGTFPIGNHVMEVHAIDGCGNVDAENIPFEVYDAKAPAPICISGLSIELMPDNNGGGAMAVWATDFKASDIWDCSEPIKYTVHRASEVDEIEAAGGELVPDFEAHSNITVTCDDPVAIKVYVYAWDAEGNGGRCETYLFLVDALDICDPESSVISTVSGIILTEENQSVQGVHVSLNGSFQDKWITSNEGKYQFNNLEKGADYTIVPEKNNDFGNGVSTYDIILISNHILGLKKLDSPYKLIAADVNNSKSITTLDLIHLRKMVLHIDAVFPGNPSWRFVDATYVFEDIANPWTSIFPEVININDLEGNHLTGRFVAIKIGDVTGDANPDTDVIESRSIGIPYYIQMEDMPLKRGQTYDLPIFANSIENIEGMQFTLEWDDRVKLKGIINGLFKDENLGLVKQDEGILTASWNKSMDIKDKNAILFYLVVEVTEDLNTGDAFELNSKWTAAEAYSGALKTPLKLGLEWRLPAENTLFQNYPNPFSEATAIGFYLSHAGQVRFTVHNLDGKLLYMENRHFESGYNTVWYEAESNRSENVLLYSIETENFRATRKMIRLK